MKREQLTVTKRDVLGKKIKKLRREGILPANIYGKDIESMAVQLPYKDFEMLFKEVGSTTLIDVEVEGKLRPVLIHNVQYDHVSRRPIHADFYQVNLKEKISTMIPVEAVGEAKAVTEKIGLLMQPVNEVEVEALPTDLPEKIEINVENLAQIDDQITVADIKAPTGAVILTDPSQVIFKVAELVSEEAQEQAEEEAAAAEAAKEEGAEGEATETATEESDGKPQEASEDQKSE